MADELTARQAAFVEEYLVDLNASAAARRAGYAETSAPEVACRLLEHPLVSKAIQAAQAARSERTGVTQDRVVTELAALAFYDAGQIAAAGIKDQTDIAKLPETVRRAIIGWGWDRNGNLTLKLSGKTAALELLGRHLGIFNDKMSIHLQGNIADRLQRLRQRGIEIEQADSPSPAAQPAASDLATISPAILSNRAVRGEAWDEGETEAAEALHQTVTIEPVRSCVDPDPLAFFGQGFARAAGRM